MISRAFITIHGKYINHTNVVKKVKRKDSMQTQHMKLAVTFLISCSLVVAAGCSRNKNIAMQPKPAVSAPEKMEAPVAKSTSAPQRIEEKRSVDENVSFRTVYFDFDKSDIRDDQRSILTANAEIMSKNTNVKVRIEGHCDERGTNAYNIALGERRAAAVRDFLASYGVEGSRITTVSYGEERPVDSGHSESAWAKNRRCEFVITSGSVSSR